MTNRFDNVWVSKPWGRECRIYGNDLIDLWFLHIRPGERTSLHCHPGKKTGLVVLDGRATVSFMDGQTELVVMQKIMLRAGLFHSTRAAGDTPLLLLELETPPDKNDLVRLDDPYGRTGKPYEGRESHVEDVGRINLSALDVDYKLGDCQLAVTRPSPHWSPPAGSTIAVLSGGLITHDHKYVLAAGDVIGAGNFARLDEKFQRSSLEVLVLRSDK